MNFSHSSNLVSEKLNLIKQQIVISANKTIIGKWM